MRQLKSRQTGASLLMTIYLVCTAAAIVMGIVKIGPHYYNDRLVSAALNALPDDPNFENMSKSQARLKLMQSFQLNNIYHIKGENIAIKRESKKIHIDINYDVVIPVIYNVDIILHFKNHFEQP
ncbi:MAG: DUF4845 domain-containing protein [Pseudomonadales bacterium]|jgi:hypothetical protein|nr:DUF4845 domain-containing protein [Pseudomonadales bacterium]